MTVVSVYCTFVDADEAARIGRTVVEERLAACINILAPCRSIYRWQGKIEEVSEVPAILKTSSESVDALVARIAELHSYEVPAISVSPVHKILTGYAEWVEENASGHSIHAQPR